MCKTFSIEYKCSHIKFLETAECPSNTIQGRRTITCATGIRVHLQRPMMKCEKCRRKDDEKWRKTSGRATLKKGTFDLKQEGWESWLVDGPDPNGLKSKNGPHSEIWRLKEEKKAAEKKKIDGLIEYLARETARKEAYRKAMCTIPPYDKETEARETAEALRIIDATLSNLTLRVQQMEYPRTFQPRRRHSEYQTVSQPIYAQPVYNQPAYTQPVYTQPVYIQSPQNPKIGSGSFHVENISNSILQDPAWSRPRREIQPFMPPSTIPSIQTPSSIPEIAKRFMSQPSARSNLPPIQTLVPPSPISSSPDSPSTPRPSDVRKPKYNGEIKQAQAQPIKRASGGIKMERLGKRRGSEVQKDLQRFVEQEDGFADDERPRGLGISK